MRKSRAEVCGISLRENRNLPPWGGRSLKVAISVRRGSLPSSRLDSKYNIRAEGAFTGTAAAPGTRNLRLSTRDTSSSQIQATSSRPTTHPAARSGLNKVRNVFTCPKRDCKKSLGKILRRRIFLFGIQNRRFSKKCTFF